MNGTVSVYSDGANKGSRFSFDIQITKCDDPQLDFYQQLNDVASKRKETQVLPKFRTWVVKCASRQRQFNVLISVLNTLNLEFEIVTNVSKALRTARSRKEIIFIFRENNTQLNKSVLANLENVGTFLVGFPTDLHQQNIQRLPLITEPITTTKVATALLRYAEKHFLVGEEIKPISTKPEIEFPDKISATTKILLAEDNKVNQMVITRMIQALGITEGCDVAENGKIASDMVKKIDYDIIFMDVSMPVMDGIEATREIRRWEKERKRPRSFIVALTAHAFDDGKMRAMEAGMDFFLTKPINLICLQGAINKATDYKLGNTIEKFSTVKTIDSIFAEASSPNCLEDLIESMNACFQICIIIDRFGKICHVNGAALQKTGYQKPELVNQNVKVLMKKEIASEHDKYLENYRITRKRNIIGLGRVVHVVCKTEQVIPMFLRVIEAKSLEETFYFGTLSEIEVPQVKD
eukprot:TRINITY_DN882_c0_g1_i2.p1 TRINITY_DN882_c0_g1~~TRINITY_DN882_c0_g1_i2.p1  ORF type:complete len:465 (-),score=55.13 TRINITY_DN882_c0_g1_i2:86-1480(-)